jgi:hypothetical protein
VANLVPYHVYNLRLRAATSAGVESVSAAAYVATTTLPSTPLQPQDVFYSSDTDSQTVVHWQAPTPVQGPIVAYQVVVWNANLTGILLAVNLSAEASICQFNSSLPALFKVRAATAEGWGPWSALAVTQAQQSAVAQLSTQTVAGLAGGVAVAVLVVVVFGGLWIRRRRQRTKYTPPPPDEYELERNQIELGPQLGAGNYGEVFEASVYRLMGNPAASRVAVKKCHVHQATTKAKRAFVQEMALMKVG